MTQHELSIRLGTSTPVVGGWETGRQPSERVLRQLYELSSETGYQEGVQVFGGLLELNQTLVRMQQRRLEIVSSRNVAEADRLIKEIWQRVALVGEKSTKDELLRIIEQVREDVLKLSDRIALGGRAELLGSAPGMEVLTVDLGSSKRGKK